MHHRDIQFKTSGNPKSQSPGPGSVFGSGLKLADPPDVVGGETDTGIGFAVGSLGKIMAGVEADPAGPNVFANSDGESATKASPFGLGTSLPETVVRSPFCDITIMVAA